MTIYGLIAANRDLLTDFAQIMNQIIGKAVIVIDKQQHHLSFVLVSFRASPKLFGRVIHVQASPLASRGGWALDA